MNPSSDAHGSNAALLLELSAIIERGDEKGLADFLALNSDLETVFLPFPPISVSQKIILPAVFYAVKKSTCDILAFCCIEALVGASVVAFSFLRLPTLFSDSCVALCIALLCR